MIPAPVLIHHDRAGEPIAARRLKPVAVRIPGGTWLERTRAFRKPVIEVRP